MSMPTFVAAAAMLALVHVHAQADTSHAAGSHGADEAAELAQARRHMAEHMGGQKYSMLIADRLEYQRHDGDGALVWDVDAWYGGDIHKLWVKTEGERALDPGELEELELQLLYSRAISPFFDLQAGLRHDVEPGPSRSHLVVGVQGLAPYWFEVDAAAFLSEEGDLTARVEAEYELLFTQRLILQPRFEVELAAGDVPELGIGSGLGSLALDMRLRYEFHRSFAPYVGVSWQRTFGDTREFARLAQQETSTTSIVAGVRIWF
jgi:copper resistance protein B